MKQIVCFLFITIGMYTNSLQSQEIIWLDNSFVETTQDKADYYRINVKLEGEISFYYKKRTLFRKVFYSKNKPNGLFYEYYETGELKETGVYENGLRVGIWKEFYKGGQIKSKGKYNKGEKVGIWKIFYKNDR